MPDWIGTTLVAVIAIKVKLEVVATVVIVIALTVAATVAAVEKETVAATSVKVAMVSKSVVTSASLIVAVLNSVVGTAREESDDGVTIKLGGNTSWAALQTHRQACYGRAIALWL